MTLDLATLCRIAAHKGHRWYDGKRATLHCDKCEGGK